MRNFGWAIHDTSFDRGDSQRCVQRGRFQTPAKMEFIDRYCLQRQRLRQLVRDRRPDKVGLEFPVFGNLWSEGMYGLFLFTCEAFKAEGCDVVFWAPLQIKAHARDSIDRPPGWPMDKPDMIEAAKLDTGGGRWSHDEADGYLCAVLAGRFWMLYEGLITKEDLTPTELRYFTEIKLFVRGKKAGKTVKRGVIHRENERYFLWSKSQSVGT